ncbi:NAD-dependent epimerase/dehydratase family protein [Aerococcus urinaeequi]|uniref:NAD-dependent epimerase/dehydratase family protein n=1 Tax=Aerococcus urinaeequi TaxID=51665 RepID=UPI00227F16E5|nr:NAD-dependent epimerase/dehydratase family protein [Aerococcus urinaeequi]MCY7731070.1 NAD-dependent epimerase/dehydratase family protein [Aerococcus urinaeequi]
MKRILLTGRNSYIGNAVEEWLAQWPEEYIVEKISVRDDSWRSLNWQDYDAIIHVAGIAHNSSDASLEDEYYRVNRDLTVEVAKKAKADKVTHFVNMSSIIVFGTKHEEITPQTKPNPDNFYGDSKLQAEEQLNTLSDQNFKITHVRPPMVYGKDSKGNFPLLAKMAVKTPIFPKYKNKRSMIYIKNLTELLRLVVDNGISGYIHPQNPEFVQTSKLVKCIAEANKHKLIETILFNVVIKMLSNIGLVNKVFGDLYYTRDMSEGNTNYQKYTLNESIQDIYR